MKYPHESTSSQASNLNGGLPFSSRARIELK